MIDKKKLVALCGLLLIACLMITVFVGLADAADNAATKKSDKKISQKRGVAGALASSDDDEDKGEGPTKLQMGVGLGSIAVMYAVTKWL